MLVGALADRNVCPTLTSGGRRWRFIGDEAARFVRAVAKGTLGGLAATAEGDGGFVGWDFEFGAAGVDEPEGTLDDERAVGAHADRDVGHWKNPCSMDAVRVARYFVRLSDGALDAGASSEVKTNSTFQLLLSCASALASASSLGFRCAMGCFSACPLAPD
jgi:hypothetical protein